MSSARKFKSECELWQKFAFATVCFLVFVLAVGLGELDVTRKTVVYAGALITGIWSIWIIKKLYDIANWWADLQQQVRYTNDLLIETKQDIKEIKQTV